MKWIRRIGISLIVTFFAVCCGALLLFNMHSFGWQTLDVPTGSMRPTIPPGSLVLMHSVPISTLKVGDVITYTNPRTMKGTITHRIIKTYKINGVVPAFITKGDANPSADVPVVGGLVKGKPWWHTPYLGTALAWSKTWTGLAVLLYLPALLLMIEEMQRMAEYLRKFQPYKLWGYEKVAETSRGIWRKFAASALVSFVLIAASVAIAFPVHAALQSNTVALVHNTTSVAPAHHNCSSNNDIDITNSSNQTASSGNTTGGTATTGSASNSNNTNVNITIAGC